MSSGPRYLSLIFLAGALVTPLVTTGCAHRVYDPYYSDYHRWDNHENVYYQQWVVEYHEIPIVIFATSTRMSKSSIGTGGTVMVTTTSQRTSRGRRESMVLAAPIVP